MNKLFTLILILISTSCFTQYEQLILNLDIENSNRDIKNVYFRFINNNFNKDSIELKEYLIDQLDRNDDTLRNEITFYNYMLKFGSFGENNKNDSLALMVNPFKIDYQQIKELKIVEVIDDDYLSRIERKHSYSDRNWINKKT